MYQLASNWTCLVRPDVGRLQVIVGVLDDTPAQFTQCFLELPLELVGARRRNGLAVEAGRTHYLTAFPTRTCIVDKERKNSHSQQCKLFAGQDLSGAFALAVEVSGESPPQALRLGCNHVG